MHPPPGAGVNLSPSFVQSCARWMMSSCGCCPLDARGHSTRRNVPRDPRGRVRPLLRGRCASSPRRSPSTRSRAARRRRVSAVRRADDLDVAMRSSARSPRSSRPSPPPPRSNSLPEGLDEQRRFFQTFPPLWEPYFGWGERVTVRRELVPGVIWSLEQEQALDVLAMNVRTTVVKLERTGGLVVFSPQAPTEEFFRLLDELGRVEHVVIPTYAIEHKVFCPAFQRRYPSECWVAEGLWSVPVDLPLEWIGINRRERSSPGDRTRNIPRRRGSTRSTTRYSAWTPPAPTRTSRRRSCIAAVAAGDGPGALHPDRTPEVISRERLLDLALDDPADAPAAMSDEALRVGWAKASLVVSFLGPSRQEQTKEGKLRWEPGYQKSFVLVSDRLIPSPILRTLVFDKGRGPTRRFLDEVCADWGFGRRRLRTRMARRQVSPPPRTGVRSDHPRALRRARARAGPDDRRAFAFLDAGSSPTNRQPRRAELLPEEDTWHAACCERPCSRESDSRKGELEDILVDVGRPFGDARGSSIRRKRRRRTSSAYECSLTRRDRSARRAVWTSPCFPTRLSVSAANRRTRRLRHWPGRRVSSPRHDASRRLGAFEARRTAGACATVRPRRTARCTSSLVEPQHLPPRRRERVPRGRARVSLACAREQDGRDPARAVRPPSTNYVVDGAARIPAATLAIVVGAPT